MLIKQHEVLKMSTKLQNALSKRERQIMEVVYRRKSASVQDVLDEIPNPPTYSCIRTLLNILESKGFLRHRKNGKKYIYTPSIPRKRAIHTSIRHMLQMYFNNSIEEAVGALIEVNHKSLTDDELDKLLVLIERARQEDHA